jgi:hypothetical protein
MADDNNSKDISLPIVNAIAELNASNKDNRERLQKSLRAGLLNVVKSVDRLNASFAMGLDLQRQQIDKAEAAADAAEFARIEAEREAARSGGDGSGGVIVNGDVTAEMGDPEKGGLLSGLVSGLGSFFTSSAAGLGLGAGALLAGAGIFAGGAGYFLEKMQTFDGAAVKDNVLELLTIKDAFGGMGNFFLEGGAFGLAMAGIGIGLAAFSAGQGVAAAVEYFAGDSNFAATIKENVKTLLSIKDDIGGNFALLMDGGAFGLAMTGIGIGLAAFSIGAGVAAAVDYFSSGTSFAQNIKDNVITLMSISDELGGAGSFIGGSAAFLLAMTGIAAGLAVFSVGSAIAGIGGALVNFADSTWSQGIKDNVKTLLSISDDLGGAASFIGDSATFLLAMTGIAAGLAAFGLGSGVVAFVQKFGGEVVDKMVTDVESLLTLGENADPEKVERVRTSLGILADALSDFGGGSFVASLGQAGAAVLNFLSGSESPVDQFLTLADNADKLDTAASALESLTRSLAAVGSLQFDGSNLNFKDFAKDLYDSVPLIEAAIAGGRVDGGWFGSDVEFKGLASPDIQFSVATQRIRELQRALSNTPEEQITPTPQSTPSGGIEGAKIEVMSGEVIVNQQGGQPVIVTAPTTVQNNSNARVNNTVAVPASSVPPRPSPAQPDFAF